MTLIALGLTGQVLAHDTSENSLDWSGEYQGKKATVLLKPDYSYQLKQKTGNQNGHFKFNDTHVVLGKQTFLVGENFIQSKRLGTLSKTADLTYLEIAPFTKECSAGAARIQCMQVKEFTLDQHKKKYYLNKEWQNFYNTIDGFKPSKEKNQTVLVKKIAIQNPAADASSLKYVAIK